MKAIKALVLFMGILIVSGLGVLGWGLSQQSGKMAANSPAAPRSASDAADGFGTVAVALQTGARIEQVLVAGERVVVRVSGGGEDRIVVLDPATGTVAGSFVLAPETPQAPAR